MGTGNGWRCGVSGPSREWPLQVWMELSASALNSVVQQPYKVLEILDQIQLEISLRSKRLQNQIAVKVHDILATIPIWDMVIPYYL